MKILLFSTPIMDYDNGKLRTIAYDRSRECPPYGLYLLATILSNDGHDVVVADLIADGTNEIKQYIKDLCNCSLVGISATTLSWPTALDIISQIRKIAVNTPIVLGGVHPSMFPTYIMKNFDVDFIIRGESEFSLSILCRALEKSLSLENVPSLTWRFDRKIVSNTLPSRLSDNQIASFPVPNFNPIKEGVYKGLSVESSRGCKFNCSFCSATYRKKWVPLSPKRFVDNLEAVIKLADKTLLKIQYIIDDEFSTDPMRSINIANEIRRRGLQPRLTYDSRVTDLLHDGFIENMAEFTHQMLVGAECGYDDGLKKIGKGITTKNIEDAAKVLSKNNISNRVDFSFIVGLPWESNKEVRKTLRFAAHLFAEYGVRILIQWYLQIPRSRLWDDFRKKQIVHEAMYDKYGFFRNLYLFRSGNNLTPSDIWDISEAVETTKILSRIQYPRRQMIEHSLPPPIYENFPPE